jgi:hypothetical protein
MIFIQALRIDEESGYNLELGLLTISYLNHMFHGLGEGEQVGKKLTMVI